MIDDKNNIQVVILAGGMGIRLREQTEFIPKPMVLVGDRPILWHIMKIYSYYGFKNFIICLGYKGEIIKDYFLHYLYRNNDFTINLKQSENIILKKTNKTEDWTVTLVNTGLDFMTGSRIKQIESYIKTKYFLLTYGDGVSDINIEELVKFHLSHKKIATITGVSPMSRFGEFVSEKNLVKSFIEKPKIVNTMINGGFFVFNRDIFSYLTKSKKCILEQGPLKTLVKDKELMVYNYDGFWQCMDTMRDVNLLNQLYNEGKAPWLVW